jgi:hypothetical protein
MGKETISGRRKMKNKEEIILKREDCLLKNEKSWRRARVGAVFLFVIFLMVILTIYIADLILKDEKVNTFVAVAVWCLFWLLIIDWLTLRIWHIDSINLYRKKSCTKENNTFKSQ